MSYETTSGLPTPDTIAPHPLDWQDVESCTVDETAASPSSIDDFMFPVFVEFSNSTRRRQLLFHFCTTLSDLIVFKEGDENLFVSSVLPLAYNSESVFLSLCAFSAAHLEFLGIDNGPEDSASYWMAVEEVEAQGCEHRDAVCSLACEVFIVFYKGVRALCIGLRAYLYGLAKTELAYLRRSLCRHPGFPRATYRKSTCSSQ